MATQVKKTYETPSNDGVKEEKFYQETMTTKETSNSEIDSLKKSIEEKDKRYDELNANFQKLQAQFETLMKMSAANANQNTLRAEDEPDVLVGCREVYGSVLATNDGRYAFKFECDEEKYIPYSDLREVLKENGVRDNKRLFERDSFYFVNPEDYKRFNIRKRIDLSHENLVRILTLPEHDMIDEINKMTNHLVDFSITHSLQFEIVKMLIDPKNPLRDWKYENRHSLERYIGQKFDDLQAAIGAIELLGRKKFTN